MVRNTTGFGVGRTQETSPRRTAPVVGSVVGALAVVLAAFFWPGYDDVETVRADVSVWALNSKTSQYGRINTASSELESVAGVTRPSTVVQQGNDAVIFLDGSRKLAEIDPSLPADLAENEDKDLESTPADTKTVDYGGSKILYVGADGALSLADMDTPGQAIPVTVPVEKDGESQSGEGSDSEPFRALSAAIAPNDEVVAVSTEADGTFTVSKIGPETNRVKTVSTVEGKLSDSVQVTRTEEGWAVLDLAADSLWLEGHSEPISDLGLEGQAFLSTPGSTQLAVADAAGLFLVNYQSEEKPDRAAVRVPLGAVPTEPQMVNGELTVAWLSEGDGPGVLWDTSGESRSLFYGTSSLEAAPTPKVFSNGSRFVLNDVNSGWVWLLPEGELVLSSQDWLADAQLEEQVVDAEVEEVTEQKPPVAMPDHFGVRAGSQTVLPVLLNDYDANRDVLSIAPGSVTELDPQFGTLSLTNDGQQLVVQVTPGASGTASFQYSATDGTSVDGLNSAPATVTLEVVPDDQNSKPFFAGVGVEDYLGEWPSPSVAPGGVASTQVLANWIDPEGDPLYLAGASTSDPLAQVLSNPDGTVTLRHLDSSGDDLHPISVSVTIASTSGTSETKDLVFKVSETPPISFRSAVVEGVTGKPVQVALDDLISGGTGRVQLAEVNVAQDGDVSNPSYSGLTFSLSTNTPGSYPVRATVEDSEGVTAEQTIRVVVTDPADAVVTTTPVTVFVRPNEDSTVDLLPAVQNPAGHVLLVSDLHVEPAEGAQLQADLVGQQLVHASGRTADDQPGELGHGTYIVSDGTGNPKATAQGTVTFMLAPSNNASPIAVDKWIRVSAGTQVDIPVLDWAMAPIASQLAVDQSDVVYLEEGRKTGLAFATQRLVRYLAPTDPGEYSIGYTVFRLGDPELRSSANIHVVVTPAEDDELSTPPTLEGRVLAGSSVTVPLSISESRMRGETYVLDGIGEQPTQGVASVAADGESVVYTANPATSGQDTFTYEVRSDSGQTATGTVNIGILDATQSPKPILYSRYLQMPVGKDNRVSLFPLDNATDPAGGKLTLDEVWPNEPEHTEEFELAQRRVLSMKEETGEVQLASSDEVGTTSFFYKAHNERGDQATGLIVTKVVHNPTQDLPVVSDTRVDAETIKQLPQGIDVLTDKTTWASGSVADLKMGLWEPDGAFEAKGSKISGAIPEHLTVVPFKVEGTSFSGEVASSYGFLKIPPAKDIPLAIRAGFPEPEVKEDESTTVPLLEAIADPTGDGLMFDESGVAASGARPYATCSVSGTTLTYSAGSGAPWRDSCIIPVKTAKQKTYTVLSLPITVVPKDPQPVLLPATVEASPGRPPVTYDLRDMVDWQGGRVGQENFVVTGEMRLFDYSISASGYLLTIQAKDDATPTRIETLSVSLRDYPDVPPASLTAMVGPAPGELPRAGTVRKSCSSKGGITSCDITVIGSGIDGQVNYFPNTPLKLVEGSVSPQSSCPGVTFAYATPDTVRASWSLSTPGGEDCTGTFQVVDAQGRLSEPGGGRIHLNLEGLPGKPTVTWMATSEDGVVFQVAPEVQSYPAVKTIVGVGAATDAACGADGLCAVPVPMKDLGEKIEFQFKAVNEVGESPAGSATAWSYRAPGKPGEATWVASAENTVTIQTTANADDTSVVAFTVDGDKAKEVPIPSSARGEVPISTTLTIEPGDPKQVTMTAQAKLAKPPENVAVIPNAEDASRRVSVSSFGKPTVEFKSISAGKTDATAEVSIKWSGVGPSTDTKQKWEWTCFVNGVPGGPVTGGADTTMSCSADFGDEVRFQAEAWGERDGLSLVRSSVAKSEPVTIAVPAPVVLQTYSFQGEGTPVVGDACPETEYDQCWRWAATNDPVLEKRPEGLSEYFTVTVDGSTQEYGTAQEALATLQGVPDKRVEVCYRGGSAKASCTELKPPNAAPGWIRVKSGSWGSCPANEDLGDVRPFEVASKGGFTLRPYVSVENGYEWVAQFPQGFWVSVYGEKQTELVWNCTKLSESDGGGSE